MSVSISCRPVLRCISCGCYRQSVHLYHDYTLINLYQPLHHLQLPRQSLFTMTIMETEWSLDYCLGCDRQTAGEAYCCQACRLADLERSSKDSEPTSPKTENRHSAWSSSGRDSNTGIRLPPAFDFAAYRTHIPTSPTVFRNPATNVISSSSPKPPTARPSSASTTSGGILTPSSSQSSLTSLQSISSQGEGISNRARNELRDYTNSFDQVRDWRRRMTTA